MKKLICVLIFLSLIGCAKENEMVPESKPAPSPTSSTVVQPDPTPDASLDDVVVNLGEDTEIVKDVLVEEDALEASFIEEAEVNPTTLVFYKDTTVKTNLNVCSGMISLTGNYKKQDDVITLVFKSTGYDFLDDVPFTFNLIEDKLQIDAASDMFSCAGVDSYVLRKADEE